jgi:hypothetical protein
MNKKRPTEKRISWTTLALNWFLGSHTLQNWIVLIYLNVGIFTDVDSLKISKKEQEEGFVKHTVEDADIMYKSVVQKLGLHPHQKSQTSTYKANFWYSRPVKILVQTPRSDDLEEAFGKIADSYIRLQETWSDEDDIVVVDEEPEVDQDDEKKEVF